MLQQDKPRLKHKAANAASAGSCNQSAV